MEQKWKDVAHKSILIMKLNKTSMFYDRNETFPCKYNKTNGHKEIIKVRDKIHNKLWTQSSSSK